MKCLTWNIEWATARSAKGKRIKELVEEVDPDVLCFTEATLGMVPANGHLIESNPDYGYPNPGDRRKVILWSKQPWQEVDAVGSESLPGGRFISGIIRGIRFVGVCIPWFDAHVRTGRKDRTRWEDHLRYIDAFSPLAKAYCDGALPVCVTGDFNQRIPRSRQPLEVAQRLMDIFDSRWEFATAGISDDKGHQLIDHITTCGQITACVDEIIPKKSPAGLPLSDHVGVVSSITSVL